MDGFGKCLHVPQESRNNGVQLRTWDCIDREHLKWEYVPVTVTERLKDVPTGYDLIRNRMTRKCAAVHLGQAHEGAWVVQWDCPSSRDAPRHFQWKTDGAMANDGRFALVHRASGKCLKSASAGRYAPVAIGTCPTSSDFPFQAPRAKQWSIQPGSARRSVVVKAAWLHNLQELCLRASGGLLRMSNCTAGDDGLWITHQIGTTGYWNYRNVATGQCLAVPAGDKQDGAKATLVDCTASSDTPTLQWRRFEWQGHDRGQLAHRESGKCLSFDGAAGGSTQITIRTCTAVPPNVTWWRPWRL
jgi:hypothetical protein